MKIRNKHDGTEINSDGLQDDGRLFTLSIIRDKRYYGVYGFYKDDGWEEVDGKANDVWHDLQKNANDLPPSEFNGSDESIEVYICTKRSEYDIACYDYILKYWVSNGGLFYDTNELCAWRELSQFNEE